MDAQQPPGPSNPVDDPQMLINENPLSGTFFSVIGFVQSYGWFLLLGVVACLYIKSKLSPWLDNYKSRRAKEIENKKYDPVTAQARLEAMDSSRRRMQEQFDAQAARHAEQMKIKEEEKRKQKIEDWEGHQEGKGYKSKYKPKEETGKPVKPLAKSKPLRQSDTMPLAGDGASCAWRPTQRRGGGGGGG